MTPEQLDAGYSHAKRQFASCGSILRRSVGLPGALKRIAYNVAWMKIDPLWVAIIRTGMMPFATRIFERILQLGTKAQGREHVASPNLLNGPLYATNALAIETCHQPSLTLINARLPVGQDSESSFARLPAESGQTLQTNSQ
jgi:hypothetical protein